MGDIPEWVGFRLPGLHVKNCSDYVVVVKAIGLVRTVGPVAAVLSRQQVSAEAGRVNSATGTSLRSLARKEYADTGFR